MRIGQVSRREDSNTAFRRLVLLFAVLVIALGGSLTNPVTAHAAWGGGTGLGAGFSTSNYGGVNVTVYDHPRQNSPHWAQGTGMASAEWFINQGNVQPEDTRVSVRNSCRVALNEANARGRAQGYANSNARVVAILHTAPAGNGGTSVRSRHAFNEAWQGWRNGGFKGLGGDSVRGGYISLLQSLYERQSAQINPVAMGRPNGVSICIATHENEPVPIKPPDKKGVLKVIKRTSDTNNGPLMAGSVFTLVGPLSGPKANTYNNTVATGLGGEIHYNGLHEGTYRLTETKPAQGYILGEQTSWDVFVRGNETNTVETIHNVKNSPTGPGSDLWITKDFPDGVVGYNKNISDFDGVELTVTADSLIAPDSGRSEWKQAGDSKVVVVRNGLAQIENLPMGTYTVTETHVPSEKQGLLSDGHIKLEVKANRNNTDTETVILENTSNTKAEQDLNEIWRALSANTPKPSVSGDSKTFTNVPVFGALRVEKKDSENGTPLSGAEFKVTAPGGEQFNLTTGGDGSAYLGGIALGEYTIEEVKAPEGYHLSENSRTSVEVTSAKTPAEATFTTFHNNEKKFDFVIDKRDIESGAVPQSGQSFADATFDIIPVQYQYNTGVQARPGEVVKTVKTDEKGRAHVKDLPLGTYRVVERSAPKGYVLNNEVIEVTGTWDEATSATEVKLTKSNKSETFADLEQVSVSTGGQTTFTQEESPEGHATFYDRSIYGRILIEKNDDNSGQPLEGAVFNITRDDSGEVVDTITTSSDGFAISRALRYGAYTIDEVTAPIPYVNNNGTWKVAIDNDGVVYQLSDGAISEVDSTLGMGYTSPESSNSLGEYATAPKARAGEAVVNPAQTFDFTVQKENWIQPSFGFEMLLASTWSQTPPVIENSGEAVLHGAEFEVKVVNLIRTGIKGQKQPGEVVGVFTTDSAGAFTVTDLPLGSYQITEVKAPEGYDINPEPIVVTAQYDDPSKSKSDLISWDYGDNKFAIDSEVAVKDEELRKMWHGLYYKGVDDVYMPDFDSQSRFTWPNEQYYETEGSVGYYLQKPKLGRFEVNKHMENLLDEVVSSPKIVESNIEFAIIDHTGSTVDVIKTNDSGRAMTAWLPYGEYTVRQLNVPMSDGSTRYLDEGPTGDPNVYALSKPIPDQVLDLKTPLKSVELDWVKVEADYENAQHQMRLRMVKTDKDTGRNILQDGVVFEIYNATTDEKINMIQYGSPTRVVDSFEIKEGGYTDTFQRLPRGHYYLKEIQGPEGYTYDPELKLPFIIPDGIWETPGVITVTVDLGRVQEEMVESSINNQPQYGQLEINKIGNKFVGWEDGTETVKVQKESKTEEVEVSRPRGNTTLTLVSEVPNPEYVEGEDPESFATRTVRATLTTDAEGAYTSGELGEGVHTVYDGEDKISEVIVDKGETDVISGVLEPVVSAEKVYVWGETVDQDFDIKVPVYEKAPLAGAVFELSAKDKVVSYDGVTEIYNAGDVIRFATEDIVADRDIYNESGRHLIWNKGDVVYQKGDALSYPEISGMNEKSTTQVVTDENGKINVSRLPLGTYNLVEVKAPTGYKMDEQDRSFTFSPQAYNVAFDSQATPEIDNPRQILTAQLDKKTLEEHPYFKEASVENTLFGLYTMSELEGLRADTLVAVANPNSEGKITFHDVYPGDYYIKEISTVNGYVLDEGEYEMRLAWDDSSQDIIRVNETNVENNVNYTTIHIAKIDRDTNTKVKGAKFKIFAIGANGEEVEVVNPDTGVNEWDANVDIRLPEGNYKAIETVAPMGYVGEGTTVQIAAVGDETVEIRVSNDATTVTFYKFDKDTGKPVTGAAMALMNEDGTIVMLNEEGYYDPSGTVEARWVSSESGFTVRGLPINGKFFLVETAAPEGYVYNGKPIEFTVGALIGEQSIEKINELTEVRITKLDAMTGDRLEGAKFEIYKKGGYEIAKNPITGEKLEFTSSAERDQVIYGLTVGGVYELREVGTPAGYIEPLEPFVFFVANDAKDQNVTISNLPTETSVKKVDEKTGEMVEGAVLQVQDLDGNVIEEWTTTGESHEVYRLSLGETYRLVEVKAPEGYGVAESLEFVVDSSGMTEVTLENRAIGVSFGDTVWEDKDKNGKQDDDNSVRQCVCDEGMRIYLLVDNGSGEGVKVTKDRLAELSPNNDLPTGLKGKALEVDEDGFVYTTVECDGHNAHYAFENLKEGKYGIESVLGPDCGLTYTKPHNTGKDCDDSDIIVDENNPYVGHSKLFEVKRNMIPTCEDGANGECSENPFGLDNPCIDIGLVEIPKDPPDELEWTGARVNVLIGLSSLLLGAGVGVYLLARQQRKA